VYRKAPGFCILVLNLATLLKVCIRSKSLLIEALKSFKYRIISSANREFDFFISYLYLFYFFILTYSFG
jgi:hypothetical protein